ncbi:MAG: M16 family metallopeptidase [Erythrobacter sp.]
MQRTLSRLFLATSLVLVAPLGGQVPLLAQEQEAHQEAGFAHETSDLEHDPRVIYGQLDNGLRYAVMRNGTPSGVAAIRMRIDTGSLNETEAQRGLAHFLEHMAFNGSENVPEGEMVKRLERFGLSFGADTNASTGFDQTIYKLNLPTVDAAVLDEAFFLMRETADRLLLDADAIERERGVIASEKAARDGLSFRAFVDRLHFFTEGSGLTERLPIGTDETIATMPREEFLAYYRGYYRPENTFVAVVGDLDPQEAIARIEQTFGDWQPVGEPLPAVARRPATIEPGKTDIYVDQGSLTTLALAALRPYVDQPDSKAERRARLIRSMGSLILNQRMMRKVNRGDAAYLAALAGRYSVEETVEGAVLSVRTSPEDWQAALADGEQELRRALQFGFTQAELDEQIAEFRRARETAVERADTRKTFAGFEYNFAEALVDAYADERVFTSPQTNLALFEEAVAQLTLAEVNAAFRELWQGSEQPAVYFVSSVAPEGGDAAIAETLARSQQVAVSAPPKRQDAQFAYTDFGTPGTVVADEYDEAADASLIRFANNVRLNFKQTDFDAGTINLRVRVGEGFLAMPRDSEGLRRLGLNLLDRSGVEAHDADELRSIFAGRRVWVSTKTHLDNDAFELLGATGRKDLAAQLSLMTAKVVAPAFRETEAERFFRSMRAWYPTHDASPEGVAAKYLPRLVRSGDTRFGYDDLDSFLTPTIEEVRAWIEPELATGLIEITVVGDVDKETVIDEVARTFGALPTRADAKAPHLDKRELVFPTDSEGPHRYYHRGAPEQALVYVYWPAPDASNPGNRYRLALLRSLFRNRLTDVLREEMGSTYSPGAGTFANPLYADYGYIFTRVTTDPEQVDKVREGILRVAREMASEPIEEDAFQRAVTPLIEDLSSSLENNAYWMEVLADAQTAGDGLAAFQSREAVYRTATAEEMSALAQEVFGSASSISAYILPAQ